MNGNIVTVSLPDLDPVNQLGDHHTQRDGPFVLFEIAQSLAKDDEWGERSTLDYSMRV